MYYLGIDGGGTKTLFTLADMELNIVAKVEKGTCHYGQVGYDGLEFMLVSGLEEVLKKTQIVKDNIKVCLGLAGYGKVKEVRNNIENLVDRVFHGMDYILKNDVEIAMAGALGQKEGVVIISGTGSIGLSLRNGKINRVGGWGYTIGDEGSAYWIGKKVIELFSKESDGRIDRTPIYNIVREYLNLEEDFDIITFINENIRNDRMEISKFSKICYQAAIRGDVNAIGIFESAAKELSLIANKLIEEFNEDVTVSYIGGVFKAGKFVINPFKKVLNKSAKVKEPEYSSDMGAILLAKSICK